MQTLFHGTFVSSSPSSKIIHIVFFVKLIPRIDPGNQSPVFSLPNHCALTLSPILNGILSWVFVFLRGGLTSSVDGVTVDVLFRGGLVSSVDVVTVMTVKTVVTVTVLRLYSSVHRSMIQ